MTSTTKRKCAALAMLIAGVVLDVSVASAGPWVPAADESYTQAAVGFTYATDRREYLLNLYGEFGVFDRLAVIVGIPIK